MNKTLDAAQGSYNTVTVMSGAFVGNVGYPAEWKITPKSNTSWVKVGNSARSAAVISGAFTGSGRQTVYFVAGSKNENSSPRIAVFDVISKYYTGCSKSDVILITLSGTENSVLSTEYTNVRLFYRGSQVDNITVDSGSDVEVTIKWDVVEKWSDNSITTKAEDVSTTYKFTNVTSSRLYTTDLKSYSYSNGKPDGSVYISVNQPEEPDVITHEYNIESSENSITLTEDSPSARFTITGEYLTYTNGTLTNTENASWTSSNPTYVSVSPTSGSGSKQVIVSASNFDDARLDTITFTCSSDTSKLTEVHVNILKKSDPVRTYSVELDHYDFSFDNQGGTGQFGVDSYYITSNNPTHIGVSWGIRNKTNLDGWCTVTSSGNTVTVVVSPTSSTQGRNGSFEVYNEGDSQLFTVYQTGAAVVDTYTISVNPTSKSGVSASGTSFTANLTIKKNGNVASDYDNIEVDDSDVWIHVEGNGLSRTITVERNDTGEDREGTVAWRYHDDTATTNIYQQGGSSVTTTYVLSIPSRIDFEASGDYVEIEDYSYSYTSASSTHTPVDMTASVEAGKTWCTYDSTYKRIVVDDNTSTSQRTALITFTQAMSGKTLTVTVYQEGMKTYDVELTGQNGETDSASIAQTGGSIIFTVNPYDSDGNDTGEYSSVSYSKYGDTNWFTTSGAGTHFYTVSANANTTYNTKSITIEYSYRGKTHSVTITQAGLEQPSTQYTISLGDHMHFANGGSTAQFTEGDVSLMIYPNTGYEFSSNNAVFTYNGVSVIGSGTSTYQTVDINLTGNTTLYCSNVQEISMQGAWDINADKTSLTFNSGEDESTIQLTITRQGSGNSITIDNDKLDINCSDMWINAQAGQSPGLVIISVDPNDDGVRRTGSIIIGYDNDGSSTITIDVELLA